MLRETESLTPSNRISAISSFAHDLKSKRELRLRDAGLSSQASSSSHQANARTMEELLADNEILREKYAKALQLLSVYKSLAIDRLNHKSNQSAPIDEIEPVEAPVESKAKLHRMWKEKLMAMERNSSPKKRAESFPPPRGSPDNLSVAECLNSGLVDIGTLRDSKNEALSCAEEVSVLLGNRR